jgi:hypothetical protein
MQQIIRTSLAFLVAAFVPATYFGALGESFSVGMLAFLVASLWIALLGLPTFFLLKRFNLVRWWSAASSGFFLAALPEALVSWPYHPSVGSRYRAWNGHKMVDYIVNGVPTHDGWIQYLYGCYGIGFVGAASATAFGVVYWLTINPNNSSKRTRVPRTAYRAPRTA